MMHKEKYDVTPQSRSTLGERLSSYYGNLRSMLLGGVLSGRRSTYQMEDECKEDTHLTSFRQEAEGPEGKGTVFKVQELGPEVVLKPKSIDLQRTINRAAHKTSEYEIPNLILRRGQSFEISITFDGQFSEDNDHMVLTFVTGRRPLQSKGTVVSVTKERELKRGKWGYQITGVDERKVSIKICTGADAIVGKYQFFVDTVHTTNDGDKKNSRYCHPDDVFILFNPWCQDDQVYLEDESSREEYVLKETGRIWMGTVGKFCVRPWNFAQFDDVCLMAALSIMEKSELGDPARGNPLLVVRSLSKVINNTERDGGVLVGNWSGKYDDGMAPYAWNGSTAILEEFLKKRKGVKFGQCWTFAAVATTVFRALGIPTRCVTNFRSAHDSDFSVQIDNFWTTDGKPRKAMNDTIWDFHVWNESWFKRNDLPDGYDGWQAFDPTPQECYEGVFTCGPSSVRALKEGNLYLGYDAKFLFAEVNGYCVNWTVDADGQMTPITANRSVVGKNISTKAVNTISRDDITSSYKYCNGTSEYNTAIERAERFCGGSKILAIHDKMSTDIEFGFVGNMEKTGDLEITLKMKNNCEETRIVHGYICAAAVKYTAVVSNDLKESNATTVIEPNAENSISLSLKTSEYINQIDPDSHVTIYVMAKVKETNQCFIRRKVYSIDLPNLELKADGTAMVGKAFDVVIKLTNPLSVPLTNAHINIEAPGMQKGGTLKIKKSIAPTEEIRETIQVKSRRPGRREVIACFYCKQMCNVTGVIEVDVLPETKS